MPEACSLLGKGQGLEHLYLQLRHGLTCQKLVLLDAKLHSKALVHKVVHEDHGYSHCAVDKGMLGLSKGH